MSLAQEIVDGEICAGCMMPFTKVHGYPVVCPECKEDGFTGYQEAIYPIYQEENCKERTKCPNCDMPWVPNSNFCSKCDWPYE